MNTILVPLDGSELATQVIPYVRTLATQMSARVVLVNIVSTTQRKQFFRHHPELVWTTDEAPLNEDPATQGEPDERMIDSIRKEAESQFAPLIQSLRRERINVELEVLFGSPEGCILEVAQQKQATMIAMVTHGYSGIRRWTIGSVTDRIVHNATIPVLVVRGSTTPPSVQKPPIRNILVPLDGSDFSKRALPTASNIATRARARIHLTYVLPPASDQPALVRVVMSQELFEKSLEKTRIWAEEYLNQTAEELRKQGLQVSTHVTGGHTAEKIIDEAEQHHSDLIVMATHGYSGIQRWSLGSVTDKVLHATHTPLVIVHTSEQA
jgi:nucleotide-binding universal stress UspA family protein